jgi:hypothetical protein
MNEIRSRHRPGSTWVTPGGSPWATIDTRLTPIPFPSARPSAPRTRAPSLHWRYPASSVLWAPPTPAAPVPRRERYRVAPVARQASRVASHRVRTCCAHYPGEPSDLPASVDPIAPSGLRPMRGDSALALNLSGPAQASLALRPIRSLTRPRRISVPEASTGRSPSPSPG